MGRDALGLSIGCKCSGFVAASGGTFVIRLCAATFARLLRRCRCRWLITIEIGGHATECGGHTIGQTKQLLLQLIMTLLLSLPLSLSLLPICAIAELCNNL